MRSLSIGLAVLVASTALAAAQPGPPLGPGLGPPGFGPPPPGFGPGPGVYVGPGPIGPPGPVIVAPGVYVTGRCWIQPGPYGPHRVCDRPDYY